MYCERLKEVYPDLFDGTTAGIFIDDTGSPGLKNTPDHLKQDRKTWVSVFVHPNQMLEVMEQLPNAVDGLLDLTGAREFHFADIWGGRGEFKTVSVEKRIGLFKFMAWIFNRHRFPIHVQTFHSESEAFLLAKQAIGQAKLGPLDLSKHEHFALYFLLYLTHRYVRQNFPETTARVFVDSGLRSHGRACKVPSFSPEFKDDLLCFADSKLVTPLQLADFVAFCVNKQQLLLGESNLSDGEWKLLEICTSANFNFINIPLVKKDRRL